MLRNDYPQFFNTPSALLGRYGKISENQVFVESTRAVTTEVAPSIVPSRHLRILDWVNDCEKHAINHDLELDPLQGLSSEVDVEGDSKVDATLAHFTDDGSLSDVDSALERRASDYHLESSARAQSQATPRTFIHYTMKQPADIELETSFQQAGSVTGSQHHTTLRTSDFWTIEEMSDIGSKSTVRPAKPAASTQNAESVLASQVNTRSLHGAESAAASQYHYTPRISKRWIIGDPMDLMNTRLEHTLPAAKYRKITTKTGYTYRKATSAPPEAIHEITSTRSDLDTSRTSGSSHYSSVFLHNEEGGYTSPPNSGSVHITPPSIEESSMHTVQATHSHSCPSPTPSDQLLTQPLQILSPPPPTLETARQISSTLPPPRSKFDQDTSPFTFDKQPILPHVPGASRISSLSLLFAK